VYFINLPGEVNFLFSESHELIEVQIPSILFEEGCTESKWKNLPDEEKAVIYTKLIDYSSSYYSQHLEILLNAGNLLPKARKVSVLAENFSVSKLFSSGVHNSKLVPVLEKLSDHFKFNFSHTKTLKYISGPSKLTVAKKKSVINDIADIETLPPCLQNAKTAGNLKDGQKMLVFWTLSKFSSSPAHLTRLVQPFMHSSSSEKQKKLVAENARRAFDYSISCTKVIKEKCCPLSQNQRLSVCGGCSSPSQFIERQFSDEMVVGK
jgi:hypothetical protein